MAKSRRLTTLTEFSVEHNLRPEHLAGFRSWLHGRNSASDDEWETLYNQYVNRAPVNVGGNGGRA